MTSVKHWISGYLKQFVGEILGSQRLHEEGKGEVRDLPEAENAELIAASAAEPRAQTGQTVNPDPASPKSAPPSGQTDFHEHVHQPKERNVSVYTQKVPEIERGHGALVKIVSEGDVVYVAICPGATIEDAKSIVVRMAKHLTVVQEKASVSGDAATADARLGHPHAEESEDLDDQLEIGLFDSFPASDPPAAATSTMLPKKHDPHPQSSRKDDA